MTGLLLISSSLIALLGLTLLMLARIEPGHRHIGDWGWSHICLAGGLALGVALVPPDVHSLHYRAQATVAVVLTLASIAFELSGAARYVGRPWRWRRAAPLFALALVLILAPALLDPRYGVRVAAAILTLGAWTAAAWLWRAGDGPERFVAALFIGSGLVHLSGPLLDPLARSAITHVLGTYLHSVLAMSLILLSVRRAHQATTTMQGRLHQLYEQSVQGMLVVRDQRILFANPAVRRIFGVETTPDEVDRSRYLSGDAAAAAAERHRQLLAGERDGVEWEADIRRRDGRVIHLRGHSSAIDWPDGRAVLELMLDDTERQQARLALERQALHDELTNLPNRHAAMARLDALTAQGEPFAVVSADLDRFQLVNESLGHEFGDALLRAVAERLRAALPPEALLARLGEDQFMAVLPGVASAAQVEQARQQWRSYFDEPFVVAGRPVFVHVSCGLACYPEHGPDGAALLSAADVAMHRAKQQAGTTVLAYAPEMIQRARARLDIEQALGAAIAAEEFFLEYQPKFAAHSRQLAGFEALVRWQRPGVGRVSPADFIPAAELTGQIGALGELVLRIALRDMAAWQRDGAQLLPVAINVSPLQFRDPQLAEVILREAVAHGIEPRWLDVEVTETAAIGHLDQVLPQLAQLRAAQVGVSFDDFGTGQSSLTLLRRLPISTLKLDRSMIDPLPEPKAGAVVRAACVLGQSLALQIVAEGVETEVQAAESERLGCTHLQGFLLSRPLSASAAQALLTGPSPRPS